MHLKVILISVYQSVDDHRSEIPMTDRAPAMSIVTDEYCDFTSS